MWDYDTDVLVVGYGGAGAAAALAAREAGARVLIVEKNPEAGGNTRYSGGSIRTYTDVAKAIHFIEAVCEGTTERSVVEVFVNESGRNANGSRRSAARSSPGRPLRRCRRHVRVRAAFVS